MDLSGKVILVTGAGRGIGRFLAVTFASNGALVIGTARQMGSAAGSNGTLRETSELVSRGGGKMLPLICDPVNLESASEAIERSVKEFGRIDALINNAGVYSWHSVADTPFDEWRNAIDVNVNAVFNMCHLVIPHMKRQSLGRIVTITSILAQRYDPGRIVYATSKAAAERLMIGLAHELKGTGIFVNAHVPGLTATDMTNGRGMDVEELGEEFLWLMSEDSDGYSGNVAIHREFGVSWGPGIAGGRL